tara:strand:- start:1358 stop:1552 length:195 start_codon:yes stop_codon:yes gene_type:complete
MTTATTVKQAPHGEYVKRKIDAKTVYIRQDYDRSTKTYCLQDTSDMNRCIYLKPGAVVFVGFTY